MSISVEERAVHLAAGTAVRVTRAQERCLVRAMTSAAGRKRVAELLTDPPEWLHTMRIDDVLHWPLRTRQADVDLWLELAYANPFARVAGPYARTQNKHDPAVLAERQRQVLVDCLLGERA